MNDVIQRTYKWLSETYDAATRQEVKNMIETQSDQLVDAFYKDIEFGTGGMRGIMGVGTNRMNRYTVGTTTLGLARYLKKRFQKKNLKVVIAHDVRQNSDVFAHTAAAILSTEQIKVYLFRAFRPTPELSYAVRRLYCQAGIVLTASHNPPEYNGYKIYGQDGSQVVAPDDQDIMDEIQKIRVEDLSFEADPSVIHYIGAEIDRAFIKACVKHASFTSEGKQELRIVFTPLHGTSVTITPEAFRQAGFEKVFLVEDQAVPDGKFSTVVSPNPEDPKAFSMALTLAEAQQADIVLGADPDADRLGVATHDETGKMTLLSGNQTNTLLIYYLLERWKEQGRLNEKTFIVSTVVSSDIFSDLAKAFGVTCKISLTGFKWIAQLIREAEGKERFIGGGEESFGFMVGDFVRDKDSVTPMLLISEIAAVAKAHGSTLHEKLLQIYTKIGCYQEQLISLIRKGADGAAEITQMIKQWREDPPKKIGGTRVISIEDYQYSIKKNLLTGTEHPLTLPQSNMLIYRTENGTKIAMRPSGTEPKIKFYFSAKASLNRTEDYTSVKNALNYKIQNIIREMKLS
ncbi:MAG: phospho-sugar mutase [Flavobacteriales bacterium]